MTTKKVWVVTEFHNCQGDDAQELDGTPVLAICSSEQVAKQISAKVGSWARVSEMKVHSDAKEF